MNLESKQYLMSLALALAAGAIFIGAYGINSAGTDERVDELLAQSEMPPTDPFADVSLDAVSAYVFDAVTGRVLFAKNAERQLPYASMTKLMTALVAREHLASDAPVTPSVEAIVEEGDSGLVPGEPWMLSELASLTLLASSNDGAHALASAAGSVIPGAEREPRERFVRSMNERAQELGLVQTFFLNESGLDVNEETIAGGYGSARDIAHLMTYVIKTFPDMLDATRLETATFTSLTGSVRTIDNTNESVGRIPWLIGGKTGFTDLAGGNLVVAFDAGLARPIVVAVMGSTPEGRFTDVEALARASLKAIALQ